MEADFSGKPARGKAGFRRGTAFVDLQAAPGKRTKMKATLLALLTVIFGLALAVHAQNMVEYSTLSTQSAATSAAAARATRHGATQQPIDYSHAGSHTAKVWQEKRARGNPQPPAKPDLPAVFVLSNGERVEAANYLLTVDSLRIEDEGKERTIPMSSLNLDATVAANHERGVNVKIPTDKTQIMLSF